MTGADRMKRYPVNFGPKGYPNKKHGGTGTEVKRQNRKTITDFTILLSVEHTNCTKRKGKEKALEESHLGPQG
jgi:hypothetical protein